MAESPADCANPTMCTRGMECDMQQNKLISDRVQNPSSRNTLLHSEPTELCCGGDTLAGDGGGVETGTRLAP